jgi:hypothetical protein
VGARRELDGGADLLFSSKRRELFEVVDDPVGEGRVEILEACRVAVGEQPDDALCFRSQVVCLA